MREPGKSGGGEIKDPPKLVAVRDHQRRRASQEQRRRPRTRPQRAGVPAPGVDQAPRLPRSPPALLEVLDGLLDDLAIDAPDLVGIADEQAVVAERIDEARDSARVLGDSASIAASEKSPRSLAPATRSRVRT